MWSEIGFKNNIFFVEPLEISAMGADLLTGRESELNEFVTDIIGEKKCLKLLIGDIGCGKTSFTNVCQYYFFNQEINNLISHDIVLLPSYRSIEIEEFDNFETVLTKINYILCTNIIKYYEKIKKTIPKSITDYLNYWTNIKIASGGGQFNISASFVGTGGGVGAQKQNYSIIGIKDLLNGIIKLKEEFLKDNNIDGIFLVIDNLDLLSRPHLIKFINEARDSLFNLDYLFWILIGDLDTG